MNGRLRYFAMNFLEFFSEFQNFLEFFIIFKEFLELKYLQKKGLYGLDLRGSDVAQREHVATPREPTGTHASPHGCLHGAKDATDVFWAWRYNGPRS